MSVRPPFDDFCQALPFGPALKLGSCRNWEEFDPGASRGLVVRVVGVEVKARLDQDWCRTSPTFPPPGEGRVGVMSFPPPPGEGRVGATAACAGTAGTVKTIKSAAGHAASPLFFKALPVGKYTGYSSRGKGGALGTRSERRPGVHPGHLFLDEFGFENEGNGTGGCRDRHRQAGTPPGRHVRGQREALIGRPVGQVGEAALGISEVNPESNGIGAAARP